MLQSGAEENCIVYPLSNPSNTCLSYLDNGFFVMQIRYHFSYYLNFSFICSYFSSTAYLFQHFTVLVPVVVLEKIYFTNSRPSSRTENWNDTTYITAYMLTCWCKIRSYIITATCSRFLHKKTSNLFMCSQLYKISV